MIHSRKKPKFIINRSEVGAGMRGSSLGPDALRIVAWQQQQGMFGEYPIEELSTMNHALNYPTQHQYAKRIDAFLPMYRRIVDSVQSTLLQRFFPIILSGDHASASGTIAGIKAAYPDKKIGVVWIDAHGDLHTPYTTPSGNIHGMPLAIALDDDNFPCMKNDVPQKTRTIWNEIKSHGFSGAKIQPQHLVFVGVRDTEYEENQLIRRLNIRNISVDRFRTRGAGMVATEIDRALSGCDLIYVSFDVDAMDPQETGCGTGTPVENGLLINETHELLSLLARHPKLVAIEFVEINPCLDDRKNRMAEISFDILKTVIQHIE